MSGYVEKSKILRLFEDMNREGIEYVLLRNTDNELPAKLSTSKDIDILINKGSKEVFHSYMEKEGWKQVQHPWDFGNNFVFLYAMDRLEFFEKDDLHIDVCYQLCCRSINAGEWMPVDMMIQDSVWKNRRKAVDYPWYEMCYEDQLVHLCTRCIFDKKEFKAGYISKIKELITLVDYQSVLSRLEVVFFRFSKNLMEMITTDKYDEICEAYLTFTDY